MSEKCKAELHIGDDFGDNHATMICGLNKGHSGNHIEQWGKDRMVIWLGDDKEDKDHANEK